MITLDWQAGPALNEKVAVYGGLCCHILLEPQRDIYLWWIYDAEIKAGELVADSAVYTSGRAMSVDEANKAVVDWITGISKALDRSRV